MAFTTPTWTRNDAENATPKQVIDYIQQRINEYTEYDCQGTPLYTMWKEDFINFTSTTFAKDRDSCKTLRDYLRKNGIYLPKARRVIAEVLEEALIEEKEWPEEEPDIPDWIVRRRKIQREPGPKEPKEPQGEPLGQSLRQQTQDLPQTHKSNYILISLSKLYSDEQKYNGDNDSFDYKYSIFLDLCEKAEVPQDTYFRAFSTMLKGAALTYYYTSCKGNPRITSLIELCDNIRQYFEGPEHKRNVLMKWNNLSLRKVIENNQGKDIEDCLQLLVQELRRLQLGLEKDLQHESFFLNKLLIACNDHPACSIACSKPSTTTASLISDLRSSIITYEKVSKAGQQGQYQTNSQDYNNKEEEGQYLTERRYYSNYPNPRQRPTSYKEPRQYQPRQYQNQGQNPKRCFVCKRQNCWSTRHSQDEQDKAKDKYKAQFNRRFDSQFSQYVSNIEGQEEDNLETLNEDTEDEFEALMITTNLQEPFDSEEPTTSFVTEVSTIDIKDATTLVSTLANKSTIHALLKEKDNEASLPLATLNTSERYGPSQFHGIMIDTGAAGKSTAGYGQYLAYKTLFGDTEINKSKEGAINATFGIGSASSIGSISINTPIGHCEFHIVNANTPFLLSIIDMDTKGIMLDNLQDKLIKRDKMSNPITRRFGHPFLIWGPMRPPDIITHDAGTNFASKEFQQNARTLSIQTKEVPVKAAQSMSLVERYHKPLRQAYNIIKNEFKDTNSNTSIASKKALFLQMAIKAINNTATLDSILQANVPLVICIDSYSLYQCLIRKLTKKRKLPVFGTGVNIRTVEPY